MTSTDTLPQQIGQMMLVGFDGTTAPAYLLDWLREGRVGGVILFSRNVESPAQLAALTRELHTAAPQPILVAIDQEGGKVARLRQPQGFTESPGAMALAAIGADGPARAEAVSRVLADEMRALGINWTYAPVLDISYNADNPTVGTRSFGSTAARVAEMAAASVRGFQAGGVAACGKHFPGLGNTAVDSHLALPVIEGVSVDDLLANDLAPYRAALGDGMATVMTTHTLFTALDETLPATLSPRIIQRLLRDALGFDGVVTTDCMEMKAIADHHPPGESALLAAQAGVDVILFSHTREMQAAAYDALLAAAEAGRLPADTIAAANRRIAALKARFAIDPAHIDPATVGSAEHRQLTLEAARAGITYEKSAALPGLRGVSVGVVEFSAVVSSEVMETATETRLSDALAAHLPTVKAVHMHSVYPTPAQIDAAQALAAQADVLIVATRNAHTVPAQRELAAALLAMHTNAGLVCLRNPYDTGVLDAPAVWCTHGDSAPSIAAMAELLTKGK